MFKEIKNVRQNEGEPHRRIFQSEKLSLTMWFKEELICCFQISYEEDSKPLVFTWDEDKGCSNKVIDEGESRSFRHKVSAVPIAQKVLNKGLLSSVFQEAFKLQSFPFSDMILNKIRNC